MPTTGASTRGVSSRLAYTALLCAATATLLAGCNSSKSSSSGAPAASSGASGGASAASSATAAAAAAGGGVPSSCPSAAAVSAAAGSTYPAPKAQASAGNLLCNYSDPTTGANLVAEFAVLPGMSAAVLKTTMDSQAQAQGATDVAVPGLGSAAYKFTLNDAGTNSSHIATTDLGVLSGSLFIDVNAQATLAQTEAVARLMISSSS